MCGIAGMWTHHRAPVLAELLDVLPMLRHRGPDDTNVYVSEQVALLHTRLSIIDLHGGQQPLFNSDRSLCLIGNGEIYNYAELRAKLAAKGYVFATEGDFEPLLYAYEEYGPEFLHQLEGMFAFALYDQRRRQLLLARDRLGIKPLFLARDGDGVYFASELKALMRLLRHPPAVQAEGLAQYLQSGFTTGLTTLCAGTERLLPGEAMLLGENGECRRWRYWSPAPVAPTVVDFDNAADEFTSLMVDVIRKHRRSDVPYGLFLSGGVDSSTLLALYSVWGNESLHTYSVGFPGTAVHSELAAAEQVAQRFGAHHTVLELDQQSLFERLPHAIWAADDLIDDYANLPVSFMAERAAADVKVVITGDGGDEVFAGYKRYRKPGWRRWLRQLRWPGLGGFHAKQTFPSDWQTRLFESDLRERCGTVASGPFEAAWRSAPMPWTDLQRRQWVDMETELPDCYLVKTDRMTMAWGLEARVPWLDHRVVDFGLALPDALKVQRRFGKVFLRRWAESWLPRNHLWQPKHGFTVPIDLWLSGPRLARLGRVLLNHAGIREWFVGSGVQQLIVNQQLKPTRQTRNWLLRLLHFAIWHSMFIEGDGRMPAKVQDPLDLLDRQ